MKLTPRLRDLPSCGGVQDRWHSGRFGRDGGCIARRSEHVTGARVGDQHEWHLVFLNSFEHFTFGLLP